MYKGVNRSPVTVIILSIVTCGIYYIYWLWQVKNDINGLTGREEISTGLFIAAIFIPFIYLIIWNKADNVLDEVCREKGVGYQKNFIMWLVLALVAGVGLYIAEYQMQEAFNKLWEVN